MSGVLSSVGGLFLYLLRGFFSLLCFMGSVATGWGGLDLIFIIKTPLLNMYGVLRETVMVYIIVRYFAQLGLTLHIVSWNTNGLNGPINAQFVLILFAGIMLTQL